MQHGTRPQSLLLSLRQILSHGIITALAVAIAFFLPQAASYILYEWWPVLDREIAKPVRMSPAENATEAILCSCACSPIYRAARSRHIS